MAREERGAHSRVRRRRHGCLGGCLTRILLLLGLAALLFVGACVLGFVKNDPVTGEPSLTLENVGLGDLSGLGGALQSGLDGLTQLADGVQLPAWAYGVSGTGLTVKTLRAGSGEAVLVCCDGYTMLVGGGSGMGAALTAQLLLCGAAHLNAVVAPCSEQAYIGALPLAMTLMAPDYLIYQDSQTKNAAYNRLISVAGKSAKTQGVVPQQGLTFSLGRATVTIVGPRYRTHTDERDDGLSVRIDYGGTSVLILGAITSAGERELISSGVRMKADALICARGGSDEATCAELVAAVSPSVALMTGPNPANSVKVRLTRAGAQVYTAKEHGVMTIVSDGQAVRVTE